MKHLLLTLAAVAGLALFSSSASAQCARGFGGGGYYGGGGFVGRSYPSYGYGHRGYVSPYRGYGNFNRGYGNFNRGYNRGFYGGSGVRVRTPGFGFYVR